jgi:hypothetical protein
MGDLVLLYFVHLGIPRMVSKRARGRFPKLTSCPHTRISDPILGKVSKWKALQALGPYQNLLDLLLVQFGPWICQMSRPKTVQKTHVCSALEDDWLVTGAFTVCKCADGLGRLVWKSGKEIVEALKAKCF